MKKVVLFAMLLSCFIPALGQSQRGMEPVNPGEPMANFHSLNYSYQRNPLGSLHLPQVFATLFGIPPGLLSAFQGSNYSIGSPQGNFRSGHFSTPIHFRYQIVRGVNLQAGSQVGSMMGSKQVRLAASFNLPSGINFSAGYGAGLSNMNRIGTSTRNQGLQVTAGYRLFKKGTRSDRLK